MSAHSLRLCGHCIAVYCETLRSHSIKKNSRLSPVSFFFLDLFIILVTSLATYLSRFLGVVSSENIDVKSKIFRWFNCIAYSTLAALIARIVVFPTGILADAEILIRFLVILLSVAVFFATKKNLVYPTILSAIL